MLGVSVADIYVSFGISVKLVGFMTCHATDKNKIK